MVAVDIQTDAKEAVVSVGTLAPGRAGKTGSAGATDTRFGGFAVGERPAGDVEVGGRLAGIQCEGRGGEG